MWKSFVAGCGLLAASTVAAQAAGPFGTIKVGNWSGGAFSDDASGKFSHCAAISPYLSGVNLLVSQDASGKWLLGFGSPSYNFKIGETATIDVMFDGQEQARLFATATGPNVLSSILPPNVLRTFQKASLMVATSGRGAPLQFSLNSTGPVLAAVTNCVAKVKAEGLQKAGDFSKVAVKQTAAAEKSGASSATKPRKTTPVSGTGFVVSANGHIVTNNHVVDGCVGDIKGNLPGEASMVLRLVSGDARNDLALLQAPSTTTFREVAKIRDKSIRSGDSVIAIGYPFHGMLTSDVTVTSGIVSSLSGTRNNTHYLQTSATIQPGNSGGPLLDMSGQVVGVMTAKLNALRVAEATGDLPENINFAIKTGALRDFLDNSVVPYQVGEPKGELKATDITAAARGYTLLITCMAEADAKR